MSLSHLHDEQIDYQEVLKAAESWELGADARGSARRTEDRGAAALEFCQ